MDARKTRFAASEALKLAGAVDVIVSLRGKKVVRLEMKASPPESDVLAALLGPSGNLRAPTVRRGRTLVVGFTPEAYAEYLGSGR